MRVVLTNDDGYAAAGLAALWRALAVLPGVEQTVVAPSRCHSGAGHTFTEEVVCRRGEQTPMGTVTIVEGTPADCACVALGLPGLDRPDWVVSGINQGGNLGVDVYNSGTVAAARQAAIQGVHAVAISQLVETAEPVDWLTAERRASAVLAALLGADLQGDDPDPTLYQAARQAIAQVPMPASGRWLWNVNLPVAAANTPIRTVRLVRRSSDPNDMRYTCTPGADGEQRMRYVGQYRERPQTPDTDVAIVFNGGIAISLLEI